MSKEVQTQMDLPRKVEPDSKAVEPTLWFQELRLLRRFSGDGDDLIRSIPLRAGLNILWSPAEDAEIDAALYRETWGGHAAGKTLFCRILRYLLGDSTYCTKPVLENVQVKIKQSWAVARVRLMGEPWIVGRSLTFLKEGFAVRGEDLDKVLSAEKPASDISLFHDKLEMMAGASLKQLYPENAWRHLMPWLARDQEARYARVTAWRDSLSEADSPSTSMSKQYALMRATIGLLKPEEVKLQAMIEQGDETLRHSQPVLDRKEAVEKRERELLARSVLQVLEKEFDFSNIEASENLLQSHREVRQQRLEQLQNEPESDSVKGFRQAYEKALRELAKVKNEGIEHGKRRDLLERQGRELMGTVDRARSAGIVDPKRSADNWCPHTLDWAKKKGCVESQQSEDQESSVTIEELESMANAMLEEGQDAEAARQRCESRLENLEAVLAEKLKDYTGSVQKSRKDASKLQREVTLLEQCESRLKSYKETLKDFSGESSNRQSALNKQEKRRKDIEAIRKSTAEDLGYLNWVFSDIIKAVVGSSIDAWVQIDGNGMHLHATKQGELSGAALETVKTLAFDLAAMVAGMEGKCYHPRLLIHDGPREADMARLIYEHFFIYVVDRLEAAFPDGKVNFQYILTTTTSPPKGMLEGSKWLIGKLSSRNKSDRLLGEDV